MTSAAKHQVLETWQKVEDKKYSFKDMDKLKFSFRLYDVDNNGVVDMEEVTAIIETLDSIEGVKPGPKQIPYRRKSIKEN